MGFMGLMFSTEVDRSRPARKPPRLHLLLPRSRGCASACASTVAAGPLLQVAGKKNRSDRGYNHRDLTPMFVGKYTLVNIQKDIEQGHY